MNTKKELDYFYGEFPDKVIEVIIKNEFALL